MTIDPEIVEFLAIMKQRWAAHPPFDTLDFPEQRAVSEAVRAHWTAGGPVMAETFERRFDAGAGELRIRVYRPEGVAAPAPALVYLHGGGFTLFSIDTHDRLMREYAAAGGFVVVGVDYPLSPEHKYPVALDRIEALMLWLGAHGATLGIDPARIAMGGDSAGANLCFATALRLRAQGEGGLIRAILSNYGYFTPAVSDRAEALFGGPGSIMDRAEAQGYYANYLVDIAAGAQDPFACPIHAELAGLPPVLLVIPECDLLTEQSIAMEARLEAAGVDTEARIYAGATHSFLEAMSIAEVARRAIRDGAAFIRRRFG
ncbi:alpha/beta hydrolase fold domain-containing protein [Sphingopyxis sp. OPL5]|uniref:alpha/beta hydrolase fold domain-containing protein n=1 Tax=Sphingopyxis sp. OPL5 TaxID=2486273 RepID=UPI00164D28F6|nr:alpha/beta hydrolase fold domain-containing protein [Sphingopyxis sp. OPL5]QNO29147.1 alpha/beta hydrolase fold domain-containing protein [Sphingopyxis sp. OPL5]